MLPTGAAAFGSIHYTHPRRQRLRTQPDVIQAFTQGLAAARTPAEIQRELDAIPGRFMSTGVYSDLKVYGQPASAHPGAVRDVDLVIELKESHHRLETGIQRTSDGQFQTALEFSALNWLGGAEKLSASLSSAKGDLNLGHLAEVRDDGAGALWRGGGRVVAG